ncbi:hypothetical protein HanPI659440_Chr08g0296321 [Helianthus annuus]|nr:hypothetical protein HanPI659440_Chr08g0296321 [Helianthus annuus]
MCVSLYRYVVDNWTMSSISIYHMEDEGWKMWEYIGPCLRGEEDAQRFEDIFLMKCLLKNKRSAELNVCAAQT